MIPVKGYLMCEFKVPITRTVARGVIKDLCRYKKVRIINEIYFQSDVRKLERKHVHEFIHSKIKTDSPKRKLSKSGKI